MTTWFIIAAGVGIPAIVWFFRYGLPDPTLLGVAGLVLNVAALVTPDLPVAVRLITIICIVAGVACATVAMLRTPKIWLHYGAVAAGVLAFIAALAGRGMFSATAVMATVTILAIVVATVAIVAALRRGDSNSSSRHNGRHGNASTTFVGHPRDLYNGDQAATQQLDYESY